MQRITSDTTRKRTNYKRPLTYNPQSDIVRAEHWPIVTGLSSTTIWRYRKAGRFVSVIQLGENSCGARRRDLEKWLDERAGR